MIKLRLLTFGIGLATSELFSDLKIFINVDVAAYIILFSIPNPFPTPNPVPKFCEIFCSVYFGVKIFKYYI